MTRSARRYHGPYLVVAQYCNEQTIIGFAPIYDGHAQTRRSGSPCRSRSRSTTNHACSAIDEQATAIVGLEDLAK
jgi:hypothetical protein